MSQSQMKVPMMMHAIRTTIVPWITWLWLGHSVFRSSPQDSPRNRHSLAPNHSRVGAPAGLPRSGRAGGSGARRTGVLSPPPPLPPPARPERGKPGAPTREWFGARLWRFIGESWGELRKTEWPSQSHVIQGTIVVLMACIIMGTFIWLCDLAFKYIVHNVLLR